MACKQKDAEQPTEPDKDGRFGDYAGRFSQEKGRTAKQIVEELREERGHESDEDKEPS